MTFELIKADKERKHVLKSLLQFYSYDISEFTGKDVNECGKYAECALEDYFTEGTDKTPYLIKQNGQYAGFTLVDLVESEYGNHYLITKFFILKKYRKQGIGKAAATKIFNIHRGQWEVRYPGINKVAEGFWRSVIFDYTNGVFLERGYENERKVQYFST